MPVIIFFDRFSLDRYMKTVKVEFALPIANRDRVQRLGIRIRSYNGATVTNGHVMR